MIKKLSNYLSPFSHSHLSFNNSNTICSNLNNINFDTLKVNTTNDVVTISLNRPNKKNAMSFAMMQELIMLAKIINQDKTVRAVILTGDGDSFCSGVDLEDLNNPKKQLFAAWQLIKPWKSLFQQVCLVWQKVAVPVISVLHGHCLGAGFQLALATDIRISHPECKFAIMEAKWGLVPDMGLTQSALGVVRQDVLKELAMTAKTIDGKQAKELGLVTHISQTPLKQAQQLAQELADRSPDAVLASKRVINHMFEQSASTLYKEKYWQIKLMLGKNRKIAIKKAKNASIKYAKRQFK